MKDETPILLEDEDAPSAPSAPPAPPEALAYAEPSTPRGPRARRHSVFAFASCVLYALSLVIDHAARRRMPGVSDGLFLGWEGEAQHFRAHYPVVPLMLIVGAGITCALVALLMPHTKKWLAVIPLPLHASFLAYLWLLL